MTLPLREGGLKLPLELDFEFISHVPRNAEMSASFSSSEHDAVLSGREGSAATVMISVAARCCISAKWV